MMKPGWHFLFLACGLGLLLVLSTPAWSADPVSGAAPTASLTKPVDPVSGATGSAAPNAGDTLPGQFRDPTVMSNRFRDAMRIHASSGPAKPLTSSSGERDKISIQLLATVSSRTSGKSQVLLKVGDLPQPILVEEGSTFSAGSQGVNVDVVRVSPRGVEIFIPSTNKTMVLQ